jgi:hypothetical protein
MDVYNKMVSNESVLTEINRRAETIKKKLYTDFFQLEEFHYSEDLKYTLNFMLQKEKCVSLVRTGNSSRDEFMRVLLEEVTESLKLDHENTLFLAVSYIDRILSILTLKGKKPDKKNLPLLLITCLRIAIKYEETTTLTYEDAKKIAMKHYSTEISNDDLKVAEVVVLKTLDYNLSYPTIYDFLEHFLRDEKDEKIRTSSYLIARSMLLTEDYKDHLPSELAKMCISASSTSKN